MFRTEFISFSYASSCNFSVLVTGTTVSQVQTPNTWVLSNVSPPFVRPQPPSDKPSSSVKRVSEVVYELIYSLCPYCFHFNLILNFVLNLLVLNYCIITSQRKVKGGQPRPRGPEEMVHAGNESQRLKNATGYDLVFLVGNCSTFSSLKATDFVSSVHSTPLW